MQEYTRSYFITALWSSADLDGNPLDDKYDLRDISTQAKLQADKDIDAFITEIEKQGLDTSEHDVSQLMHDFWLTRNGHGAGFWDGDYEEELGEKLTAICKKMGSIDLYVGDDNKIYSSKG